MAHFCKNHILLAMSSGMSKAKDGIVTVKRDSAGRCNWSGCATPTIDLHLMSYEKEEEPTTSTSEVIISTVTSEDIGEKPTEEKSVPA